MVLWRLDADWGYPIMASNGSTRTRCKGNACHSAAPNRFFLTRAAAEAGRLHKCCLAQPIQVSVPVDESVVRTHLDPSLEGIDLRTAHLPDDVHQQFQELRHKSVRGPGDGTATRSDGSPSGVGSARGNADGKASIRQLAFTGSSTTTAAVLGAGAVMVGAVLTRRTRSAAASPEASRTD